METYQRRNPTGLLGPLIWACSKRRHKAGWPIIISLHFLSGLQSSCLCSGCCMISTVQDQQPWHADSQNRQPALILTDSSCITEAVLFERAFEGSRIKEPRLHLWCDFSWQSLYCSGWSLSMQYANIMSARNNNVKLVAMKCVSL